MLPAVKNILSSKQIKAGDRFTIAHENIRSIDLMERAARGLCDWIVNKYTTNFHVYVFCGNGNNGADGMALGRLLTEKGYHCSFILVSFLQTTNPEYDINLSRIDPKSCSDFSEGITLDRKTCPQAIVIDALVGIGLNRPPAGLLQQGIHFINRIPHPIIAVDIPSGLFADDPLQNPSDDAVRAHFTLSFETPKKVFLLPEFQAYVGQWESISISIAPDYYATISSQMYFTSPRTFQSIYRPLNTFEHKGTRGHLLLIAGQKGMLGAALLAAKAALHCGLGKLSLHAPIAAELILQTSVPEALFLPNQGETNLEGQYQLDFDEIAIGPGIGQQRETVAFLSSVFQKVKTPLVLDADAINILAKKSELIKDLPKHSILTPHPKEFDRLSRQQHTTNSRFDAARQWAKAYQCYLVLKGSYSIVFTPEGTGYINCSGNAGLATAGSGDVLTGCIGSFLAQGYSPFHAAVLGVYVHGRAADQFAAQHPKPILTASMLPKLFSAVFQELESDMMS